MYVQSLSFDDWHGAQDLGGEEAAPSLDHIEARLHMLDGRQHTLIVLGAAGDAHMAIGGGESSRYIVYATFDGQHFSQLHTQQDRTGESTVVRMIAGGQLGEYPVALAVSLEEALKAAGTFALDGRLDPSLSWH